MSKAYSKFMIPHITRDENDTVVLEYWNGDRKLTLYLEDEATEYIKVWGPDIENDMEDGILWRDTTMEELFDWLTKNEM